MVHLSLVSDITYIQTDEGWLYLAGLERPVQPLSSKWRMTASASVPNAAPMWRVTFRTPFQPDIPLTILADKLSTCAIGCD